MIRSRFAAGAAVTALAPSAIAAQPRAAIRVAATANDTYAQAYYAHDLGWFAKAGLDVAIQTFTAGGPVTTAVAAGSADIGIAGPPTIAAASLHGIPFSFLAPGGIYSADHPGTGIVVARNAPIRTAKDLTGKTLAVGAIRDGNWLAAVAWIDENGGDSSNVRFVELPFSEMGDAIRRGTIDGATLPEPSQTRAMKAGGLRMFGHHFDAFGRRTMIGGWFARTDWIDAHRDAAGRYAAVMLATARWANAHRDLSAPILAKYSKIDGETMRTMIRSDYGTALNPGLFQRQLDLAFDYKVIERQVSAAELIAHVPEPRLVL